MEWFVPHSLCICLFCHLKNRLFYPSLGYIHLIEEERRNEKGRKRSERCDEKFFFERTIVYDFLKNVTKHANFSNDGCSCCYPCFLQPW